jgi:hypothetical protein
MGISSDRHCHPHPQGAAMTLHEVVLLLIGFSLGWLLLSFLLWWMGKLHI